MNRYQTRYALLGILLVLLTPIAIAQSTAPQSPSTAGSAARDFGLPEIQSETITPANILNGEPRDLHDEQPQTWCNNNPLTGKIPVECVRWSEMA